MSEPAYRLLNPPGGPDAWLPIEAAAAVSGIPLRTLQYKCQTKFSLHGLAKKAGGSWLIHRSADPRLSARSAGWLTRAEAMTQLSAAGVAADRIETARRRADVLAAFAAFCQTRPKPLEICKARKAFVRDWDHHDIELNRVSVKTLERWEAVHRAEGLAGLVPGYQQTRSASGAAKSGLAVGQPCHPEALQWFLSHFLTEHRRRVAAVVHVLRGIAEGKGWAPIPSTRWFQKYVRENLTEDQLVLHREGGRAFAAQCVPKIARDYSELPAGQRWCGDERTMDLYARVPAPNGGWRRVRPVLTTWLDERSRMFVGWHIGEGANTDTILAAFKRGALTYGLPAEVYIDNGKDYRAAGGKRRTKRDGKWGDLDQDRIDGVFGQLEVAPVYAIPYQPWSKMIESHFRTMADYFDKWFDSYCGGTTQTRPTGAAAIPIEDLPTLIDVRESFETWLVGHHEKPQSGSGMDGLSPRQAFDTHRGVTRTASADLLDRLCARRVGPRVVGRDGVRLNGLIYGQSSPEVWKLKGKRVWLLLQPDDASKVTLVDESGAVLAVAQNDRLTGTGQGDIRKAASLRKQRRALARKFTDDVLPRKFQTPLGDVIEAQAIAARAAQPETPGPPDVHRDEPRIIKPVRPDLHEQTGKPIDVSVSLPEPSNDPSIGGADELAEDRTDNPWGWDGPVGDDEWIQEQEQERLNAG